MDRESESPLIGGMGLSGHGTTAFARAHAREEGEGGWGRCETRICSSKRAASRSACNSLPHSVLLFCTPLRACEANGGGCTGCIPGQRLNQARFQCWNILPTFEIVGFQELQDGVGINPSQPGIPAILGFMRRNGGDRRNETKRDEPRDRLGPRGRKGCSRLEPDCSGLLVFLGLFSRLGWRVGWDAACVTFVREPEAPPPASARGEQRDGPGWSPTVRDCWVFRLGWNGRDGVCVT